MNCLADYFFPDTAFAGNKDGISVGATCWITSTISCISSELPTMLYSS